ncbi:deoxycytidylate deaminase [Streptomyces sp. NPDC058861]|uniref:deoxycytidylate deaminase n=1 Tax=Streptomyces sp. NPDC058861 TaxID=3346653 RepID=UPI0036A3F17D
MPTTEYDLTHDIVHESAVRTRPAWDEYFLGIATAVAARGDCLRSKVGAVLVDQAHRIRGTGYNGTPPGGPSCLRGECGRCRSQMPSGMGYEECEEVHAEANALLYAHWAGCQGATLYITRAPCRDCSKLIRAAGVSRVVWMAGDSDAEWQVA